MRKKIGIGISDFRKLRQGSYLFIDKSLLIQEIIQGGADIILLPCPRYFGNPAGSLPGHDASASTSSIAEKAISYHLTPLVF